MPTPVQDCPRVLSALEDLVAQEAAIVALEDYAALADVQRRSEPLVAFLARYGAECDATGFAERIVQLGRNRARTQETLRAAHERARTEIQSIQAQQRVLRQVAPAYMDAGPTRQRLSLVG